MNRFYMLRQISFFVSPIIAKFAIILNNYFILCKIIYAFCFTIFIFFFNLINELGINKISYFAFYVQNSLRSYFTIWFNFDLRTNIFINISYLTFNKTSFFILKIVF